MSGDERYPDAANMSCDYSVQGLDKERWRARNSLLATVSGIPDHVTRREHTLAVNHLCTHYEQRLVMMLRYAKVFTETAVDIQRRLDAGDIDPAEASRVEQLGDRMWAVMMTLAGVKADGGGEASP